MRNGRRVAVVGGGWAGLAAAVLATQRGHQVTVYEMAAHWGGRARQVNFDGLALDNGQHILIGAYTETLALMRTVGVDPGQALLRMPLRVTYPDGAGLQLPEGSPLIAFARAVLAYPGWNWRDKLAMLRAAGGWALRGFRCDDQLTVDSLVAHLPRVVRDELLDPLCVAALNTPAPQASARVFLRVLRDALFSGAGSADLLLPRQRLSALWPDPAAAWLQRHGATLRLSHRVDELTRHGSGWNVDGETFDAVVLASTATEAARLAEPHVPAWAGEARALRYEPIITVYARSSGARLPQPMMALRSDDQSPAQFVFDLGTLGAESGLLAFVISGAAAWVERGTVDTLAATLGQARRDLQPLLNGSVEAIRLTTEKRATFLCTPAMKRPSCTVAPGLCAAGDFVAGPYPATLEGAIRSAQEAVRQIA